MATTETSAAEYEATWNRLLRQDDVFGIGAKVDGKLIGIAHYLFHTSAWATTICYLQDLFVAPEVRGKGTARALIEAVAVAGAGQSPRRVVRHVAHLLRQSPDAGFGGHRDIRRVAQDFRDGHD